MKITGVTRRDLIDLIKTHKVNWAGRLEEPDFLARLFDVRSMPSDDPRFPDAYCDIGTHRVSFNDWDDDWVFHDSRFDLMNAGDQVLLQFLCETLHPEVRPDVAEVERLCELYNGILKNDGFRLVPTTYISSRPVYTGRNVGVLNAPGVISAKSVLHAVDPTYVAQQITRMESSVDADPGLAIGTAKELIETICKTILNERKVALTAATTFPQLLRRTTDELKLTPDSIPDSKAAAKSIKQILGSLGSITQGIAELRNKYGTGHGTIAKSPGLLPRHAKLAVGAASTLAVFLVETHQARK
jgi:hypothetical protein